MPPKTAKKKKKTGNNKTQKKKKKTTTQFNVDGKRFRLKDDSSWTRIEKTDSEDIIKFKPDLWPDDANQAWDELQSEGLIKYGRMYLKTKTISEHLLSTTQALIKHCLALTRH